jgi:integrase
MATVKFLLQSKSESAQIYVYLSNGRGNLFHQKTGLLINAKDWSSTTHLPKQNSASNKNKASKLRKLKDFILDEVSIANSSNINKDWLKSKIDIHFDRVEAVDLDYLTIYGEYFIKHLKYKANRHGGTGVSKSTEKKYQTVVNKLIAFEKHIGNKIKLTDVGTKFRADIIDYFNDVDRLSSNTIGRYLKFVKSICLDAQKNGYSVSIQLNHFHGFTVKAPKVILSLDEIEKIKNAKFVNESHEVAKDWLIIGCFTGQRVSDLLRMKKSFIEDIQDYNFIVLEQIKTKKTVQIPIHYEVQEILNKRNGEFPPTFAKTIDSSKAMFNLYLKQLCKIAEIYTVVNGNKYDEVKKRYINGKYPKHELVSSHICRRSFASNFYGNPLYPTPILMNITAHSTEKMFLDYIGKKPIDYSLQLAKIWQEIGLKRKQATEGKAKLELVQNVSI